MAKQHFDYPLAVYVATFANGETARLSVGARKGKVDFDRARRMVAHMWREGALPHHGTAPDRWGNSNPLNADDTPYRVEQYWSVPDRTDIVAGHIEHNGRVIADPVFARSASIVELAKRRKVDPVDRVLTALDKLSLSDLETIVSLVNEMIDQRLVA
jgi:hypothetical protein